MNATIKFAFSLWRKVRLVLNCGYMFIFVASYLSIKNLSLLSNINIPERPKCAIIIYGLPRSFNAIVLPTLKENIIKPNVGSHCDYFVSVYLENFDEALSHPGRSGKIYANETYHLEQAVLDIAQDYDGLHVPLVRFTSSTNEDCFKRYRELFLKMHFLKDESGHWIYFPQILHSWNALELAWDLMERAQMEHNFKYDVVAMFRSDVAYATPINMNAELNRKRQKSLIVSSVSATSDHRGKYEAFQGSMNHIAFGHYEAAKVWSTGRFTHLHDFLTELTNKDTRFGFNESVFMAKALIPSLKKKHFSVKYDPKTCIHDVLPDQSVSLLGCDDITTNKERIEKIVGIPCIPSPKLDIHSESYHVTGCSWKEENIASWISSVKKENDSAAICVIVSNEEYYLDEWIDYNLGIGFSHIYIYDNTDAFDLGHSWLVRRPRLNQKVTVTSFPGQDKQGSAYQHCGHNYLIGRHRWVGFFDADEFLVLKKHNNVVDFLMEYCERGAVSLNWQVHSWNEQLQFSPAPVTKRFQGMHTIDQHVKTISNVDAVNWTLTHHPHYTYLKHGYQQLDTNGAELSPNWQNLQFPSDVALFYHHHTKSWREYIGKRSRGRATMSGIALEKSRNQLVELAKNGVGLHNSTRIDSSAWDKLKSISPKYSLYEQPNYHLKKITHQSSTSESKAICSIVFENEAYLDEWVDYHLALGFSSIHLIDSSELFWFRQWGAEKRNVSVDVTHFPGNARDPSYIAKSYMKCLELHGRNHTAMVFMEVNDFLIFSEGASLEPLSYKLESSSSCAHPVQRVLFGNAGQFVYDPLPVTKRFMFRIEPKEVTLPPVLIFQLEDIKNGDFLDELEKEISEFLLSGKWKSQVCPNDSILPENMAVYHYLRSIKECTKERGDNPICQFEGTVEDAYAWRTMQLLMPDYSGFDGFL